MRQDTVLASLGLDDDSKGYFASGVVGFRTEAPENILRPVDSTVPFNREAVNLA